MTAAHTPGVLSQIGKMLVNGGDPSEVVRMICLSEPGVIIAKAETVAAAERLTACWNALHGLTLEQVEVLGAFLGACNVDEIAEHIDSIRGDA